MSLGLRFLPWKTLSYVKVSAIRVGDWDHIKRSLGVSVCATQWLCQIGTAHSIIRLSNGQMNKQNELKAEQDAQDAQALDSAQTDDQSIS
jgi:hypothetical protein